MLTSTKYLGSNAFSSYKSELSCLGKGGNNCCISKSPSNSILGGTQHISIYWSVTDCNMMAHTLFNHCSHNYTVMWYDLMEYILSNLAAALRQITKPMMARHWLMHTWSQCPEGSKETISFHSTTQMGLGFLPLSLSGIVSICVILKSPLSKMALVPRSQLLTWYYTLDMENLLLN